MKPVEEPEIPFFISIKSFLKGKGRVWNSVCEILYIEQALYLYYNSYYKLVMVVHVIPALEAERGDHSKFKASLAYIIRPCHTSPPSKKHLYYQYF